MIRLRRALSSDAPAIARVWHDSWHAGHARLKGVQQCLLDDRSMNNFAEQTPKLLNSGQHLVAEHSESGRLAGFVSVDASEITQIFVEPALIGSKGRIGSKLLAAAESSMARAYSASAEDSIRAIVHAHEQNARARQFYQKHGWTQASVLADSKIETTLLRPGALHAVLFMHPWPQVRFEKALCRVTCEPKPQ